MDRNRITAKFQAETPPIVPRTAREWLIPLGNVMLAAAILLGCALAYVIGRQAHLLAHAADRH
jgi:hypothetical protein